MLTQIQQLSTGEFAIVISALIGISAAIGSVMGALFSLLGIWLTNRSQERRHHWELGVQVALAKYKKFDEYAQWAANEFGREFRVPPFNVFLIDGIRIMEIVSNKRLNADQIAHRISELIDFTKEIDEAVQTERKRQK
jgi:hypothetical protein